MALTLTTSAVAKAARSRGVKSPGVAAFAADAAVIAVTVTLAVTERKSLPWFDNRTNVVGSTTIAIAIGMSLAWLVLIGLLRGYDRDVFGAGADEFKRVIDASVLTAATVGIACYLAKFQLSRGFFLLSFAVGVPLLLLGRLLLRRTLHHARRHGSLRQTVLVVGQPSHVDEITAVLRRESWLGYEVTGALVPDPRARATDSGVPILGSTDEVAAVALRESATTVLIAGGAFAHTHELTSLAWDLEEHAVEVIVAPNVTDISLGRVRFRPVGGMPLVHIEGPRAMRAARWSKRAFDLVASFFLVIILSPVLAFAAWRVRHHDSGPALFSHTRVGRDGQTFECLKFRTMVLDAEAQVEAMQQDLGVSALLFKVKDDPRITKPGRWLRRYSVDELPQLFNVLRGDMSLVGPRPQVPREVALYEHRMHRRLRVRPGLTGLWQVSGRNDLSPTEAMRLDIYYVDNWSMLQDITILARTTAAVLRSRGAY